MTNHSHKKLSLIVGTLGILAFTGAAFARDTYDYDSSCPKSPNKADKWGFFTCNCTSYAADKMNEHGVKMTNTYKQPKGYKWSDAGNWIDAANRAGISYNSSPKHRDIAWFSYKHVAYVESVDAKGNITVSEYNYKAHDYTMRSIKKGTKEYPQYFIHFGAK
jgi:surface antigen